MFYVFEKNLYNSSGVILRTGFCYNDFFKKSLLKALIFGGNKFLIGLFLICLLRSL